MKPKLHAGDIEILLSRYFNPRVNLIVPNVFWGLGFRHELDMLIVTPAGWATEIEIKVTLSDLKAEQKKRHLHMSDKIRRFYFAVPLSLQEQAMKLIPERAGLFVINPEAKYQHERTVIVKNPHINRMARKLAPAEITKLGKLAAMRIWSLKEVIYRLERDLDGYRTKPRA